MSNNTLVGDILQEIQAKALRHEAAIYYTKALRSKVAVYTIDPFTGTEVVRLLRGDPTDPKCAKEDYMLPLYTDYDIKFFEHRNRDLIERGLVIPYSPEVEEIQRINAVTDEELKEALNKKFFAVKALLDRFTSPIPVDRMLKMAKAMNKTIGTVNAIEARLAELQEEEYSNEVN